MYPHGIPMRVPDKIDKDVTDTYLDEMYSAIDALMRNGNWGFLNEFYRDLCIRAWRLPIDVLIGHATVTYAAKSKIPARKEFMEKCWQLYPDVKLWQGLLE